MIQFLNHHSTQKKMEFLIFKKKNILFVFTWLLVGTLVVSSSVDDCSFFSSLITDDSIDGDLSELGSGVRRIKKFIRFWVLYRSRIALTSVFLGGLEGVDVDVDVDEDVVEACEGTLERIRLVVVDFDVDESLLLLEEGGSLDFVLLVVLEEGVTDRLDVVGFDNVWVFAKRWEIDDDEEFTLFVDDGLIERLRSASDDACACCNPGVAGRGIKPNRVGVLFCPDGGSGARFVVDIGRIEPVILK